MAVEASIVTVFGDEESQSAVIKIEIDDQHVNNQYTDDGEVKVKSSFLPNDKPVFIIHHDSFVKITSVKCTNGSVQKLSTNVSRSRETDGLFSFSGSTIDTGYVGLSSLSYIFYGNNCAPFIESSLKSTIKADSGTFPSYGKFTYTVNFQEQWMLTPPSLSLSDDESYTIYVVVYVESIKK